MEQNDPEQMAGGLDCILLSPSFSIPGLLSFFMEGIWRDPKAYDWALSTGFTGFYESMRIPPFAYVYSACWWLCYWIFYKRTLSGRLVYSCGPWAWITFMIFSFKSVLYLQAGWKMAYILQSGDRPDMNRAFTGKRSNPPDLHRRLNTKIIISLLVPNRIFISFYRSLWFYCGVIEPYNKKYLANWIPCGQLL
jgi:hypothetical protein